MLLKHYTYISVQINNQFNGNYIRFNRSKPQKAIEEINRRMSPSYYPSSKKSEDLVSWLLGGAVLLAIISLLTTNTQKS